MLFEAGSSKDCSKNRSWDRRVRTNKSRMWCSRIRSKGGERKGKRDKNMCWGGAGAGTGEATVTATGGGAGNVRAG